MDSASVQEMFRQATLHHQQGRRSQAEGLYRAVLNFQPDQPYCLQQLGLLLAELGRPKEAVPFLEKSCRIKTDLAAFWSNLGEIYRQVDRLVESQQAFHRALRIDPFFPEAHYNLANVLKLIGRHPEAITHYDRAVSLRPNYDRAWYNLGNTLSEEGRSVPAVEAYRKALAIRPDWSDVHLNLANALYDLRDLDAAAASYRRAAELRPADADLDDSLGNCLVAAGRIEEAREAYARSNIRRPEKWMRALRADLLAPVVASDAGFIDEYRTRVEQALVRYADRGPIDPADLHTSGAEPPMLLTYQGRDDRGLKERVSQFFRERLPVAELPARREGRPAVGVVVTRGHEGVFARCLGPLIARLDRTDYDVNIVCTRSGANILQFMLPDTKWTFTILPDRVDAAAQHVRQVGYDVLVYWEIGTDSTNYFLPYYRPARVQVNSWGWPVTSGHAEVESYLSAADLEPQDAERYYSERLVQMTELPTYYLRPPVPENPRGREAFGFAADHHVYLCQQNVRKYHPEFDAILAGILRSDAKGIIGVIADEQPAITALLRDRLTKSMPDVVDRVRILDRLEREPYLELVSAADVILDTIHYGGGANTVLDAVACGSPLVTLRGAYHRGHWGSAVNGRLGLGDLCADTPEQYVSIATAVAADRNRRAAIRGVLSDRGQALFENSAAVREWDGWLRDAVARARA
jgi:predicted O-linked N-acetylglucosamine transferase (SPINDLY family)